MSKTEFKKRFPKLLKLARTELFLTQAQVAYSTGLTADWICHFEAGRRLPDAFGLYQLQKCLGNFI